MRLRSRAVVCVFAALAVVSSGEAGLGRVFRCVRVAKPMTIDGKLDDWAGLPQMGVDIESCGPTKPRSKDDLSYVASLAWDKDKLYLSAEVTDDALHFPATGTTLWQNDSFCLCLDAKGDSEVRYQPDDYQFVFAASNAEGKPEQRLYRNSVVPEGPAAFIVLAARRRPKGYTIEVAIPWKNLTGGTPKPGQRLGLGHFVHDNDGDAEAIRMIAWINHADPAAYPITWGHLILVETGEDDVEAQVKAIETTRPRLERILRGEVGEFDNDVAVAVGAEAVGTLELGIGWNTGFFYGSLRDYTDAEWKAWLDLLMWTNPQWLRYALHFWHWEPRNDDHDPNHFNWDGFAFDSPWMRTHYRVLDRCEKEGVRVMINNRACGPGGTGWMAETVRTPGLKDTDDRWHTDHPYDEREFVESMAALVHHLKTVKRYKCVTQVSLWNEPDGGWSYNSPSAFYPYTFFPLFRRFHDKLTAMKLRDQVLIVGPDGSSSYEDLPAIPGLLRHVRQAVDVVAEHDYKAFLDGSYAHTPIAEALPAYAKLVKDLDAMYGRHVPFGIAEFGNSGNGAGGVNEDKDVWVGTLATTELTLRAMQVGVGGFLRWEFQVYGRGNRNFGALTSTVPGKLFAPYRPVYFGHALVGRYCALGSSVLKLGLAGGRDENKVARAHAAALLLPDGHVTLYFVNDGLKPKSVSVTLPAVKLPTPTFQHLWYDGTLPATIQRAKPIAAAGGALKLTLRPQSIVTLTTRTKGTSQAELEAPLAMPPARGEPRVGRVPLAGGGEGQRLTWQFSRPATWGAWRSSDGKSEVTTDAGRSHSGPRALAIRYDFVSAEPIGDGRERLYAGTSAAIGGRPLELKVWVCGDGGGQYLSFTFTDAKGETFSIGPVAPLSWTGWKQLTVDLSKIPEGFGHWGKDGDGVVDYPIRHVGFGFEEPEHSFVGRGTVYLDDLEVLSERPGPKTAEPK